MEDTTVKRRNRVATALLASAGFLALSPVSFSIHAGTYGGRPVDQARPAAVSEPQTSRAYVSQHAYVGRRIDNPRAILEARGIEQAELAAFEEGRPAGPRRAKHPYTGRRVDALPFLLRE